MQKRARGCKHETAVDLQPGEQILSTRFSSPEQLASAGVHAAVPTGMQEVSIAVDLQRIAGGAVGPGDRMGVFASFDDSGTSLLLNQVLVTSIASTVDPNSDEQQAQGLVLVTLALNAEDAMSVVHAAEFGHIWMSAQNDATALPGESPERDNTLESGDSPSGFCRFRPVFQNSSTCTLRSTAGLSCCPEKCTTPRPPRPPPLNRTWSKRASAAPKKPNPV